MKEFMMHIFTQRDNKTFDIARVLFVIAFAIFAALTVGDVYGTHNHTLPLVEWSQAFAVMFGAGAGSIGARAYLEKDGGDGPDSHA